MDAMACARSGWKGLRRSNGARQGQRHAPRGKTTWTPNTHKQLSRTTGRGLKRQAHPGLRVDDEEEHQAVLLVPVLQPHEAGAPVFDLQRAQSLETQAASKRTRACSREQADLEGKRVAHTYNAQDTRRSSRTRQATKQTSEACLRIVECELVLDELRHGDVASPRGRVARAAQEHLSKTAHA